MESEFIALDKTGEEAEWLRDFLEDILYWPKPVAPVCIHCDCQAAIGRAGSMMYNAVKTRLCSKYNTAEGCKFGEKCRFAHGDWELGRPAAPLHEESHGMFQMHGRYGSRPETNPAGLGAAASFGSSATAKISVDASLAGRIIGKGGVNSKQICRVTGAKLSIRDHELDPNLRNIELEGTIDQLEQASRMVRELIQSVTTSVAPPKNTSSSATTNNNQGLGEADAIAMYTKSGTGNTRYPPDYPKFGQKDTRINSDNMNKFRRRPATYNIVIQDWSQPGATNHKTYDKSVLDTNILKHTGKLKQVVLPNGELNKFDPDFCIFQDLFTGKVKEIDKHYDGLYYLAGHNTTKEQKTNHLNLVVKEDISLWHKRMRHAF
ncbi:Zinc finger CCCH domain-containing protein 14 [Capsicum annuum]|uniref:Zinc finger CCCH domain-containing protein 14 n=1 Tax=Capsicum annuum TaxID=4072 RepID=A0A2G3AJE2_CAPAN|nr:Zinc finger CCCH domain-containing protein 14 [Capsicum annuum]